MALALAVVPMLNEQKDERIDGEGVAVQAVLLVLAGVSYVMMKRHSRAMDAER